MSTTIKQLPGSVVEVTGTLTPEEIAAERAHVLRELQKDVKLDGFRRGHIPEKVLVEKVGEDYILGECIEHALKGLYPEIIVEHNLFPLGSPKIALGTKVEAGKPVAFTITTAVLPTLTLPDYKKLAAGIVREDAKPVEDKDVDAVLADLQRLKARQDQVPSPGEERVEGEVEASALPTLDDTFAQSFGPFKDLADLRAKMRENLSFERTKEAKDKYRLSLLEAVVKDVKVELPQILIDSELNVMRAELENSISRAGLQWAEYLKQIKKTDEELRTEWTDQAKKRAVANLTLREIGKIEKLGPNEDEINSEVLKILRDYENADPERTRQYVEEVLFNDKVFAFLEKQKQN